MTKKKTDKLNLVNSVLTTIFPFYGIFYYYRNKDEKPRASKTAIQLAIVTIIIMIVSSSIKYQIKKNGSKELKGVLQDKLSKFLNKATRSKSYNERLNIGYISGNLSKKIKKTLGVDFTGYEIFLYAKNIRKMPEITQEDYYFALNVLSSPQIVTEVTDSDSDTQIIKITNQYNVKNTFIVVLQFYKDYCSLIDVSFDN